MKVVLPSNGILGKKSVDMRPATFQDLRNVVNLNQEEELLRIQFVQALVSDLDLTKITKMDMDYLFTVAAMQVQLNCIGYKYTCKCGHKNQGMFNFGDQEVTELPKIRLPFKKVVRGKTYEYYVLSAQQHMDACEYALQQEDFQSSYENAVATFIFGKTLDDIEEVKNYDIALFLSAFLFQKVMFHGIILDEKHVCKNCGKVNTIGITADTSLVKMSMDDLMNQFSTVMSLVDFESFLSFTMPEFKIFRDKLSQNDAG